MIDEFDLDQDGEINEQDFRNNDRRRLVRDPLQFSVPAHTIDP